MATGWLRRKRSGRSSALAGRARPKIQRTAIGEEVMKHDLSENGTGEMTNIIARLAGLINDAGLDCECHSKLDEALSRFVTLEIGSTAREHLINARLQRAHIRTMLLLLQDLEEIGEAERDSSVYLDFAYLFDDIAAIAKGGSHSMRQLSQLVALSSSTSHG